MVELKLNRRSIAYLGVIDTPILHLRNPYVIAFWSITFPGFGHLLLGKYCRGFLLVIWEFFLNQHTKLNTAMVYTFIGEIERVINCTDEQDKDVTNIIRKNRAIGIAKII